MPNHKKKIIGRAFVVRPFGEKVNSKGEKLLFEDIHDKLICPALRAAGLAGETTMEFIHQGNIREDMFHELLVADLVIADISLHNANAFYELGIRHALRDRATVLIRADKRNDKGVFDLATDRYMTYDPDHPETKVGDLTAALEATLAKQTVDSPVFKLLPNLRPADPAKVIVVPRTLAEDVELAAAKEDRGILQLLAQEVQGMPWESQGLRLVGRAQFELKDFTGATATWERFRTLDELDIEANRRLATTYQRQGQLTKADHAVKRILSSKDASDHDRAEFHSLWASNEKTRWREVWQDEPSETRRQQKALSSPYRESAAKKYAAGFLSDRNHYYSGLNALAMVRIAGELATLHREVWDAEFEDETRAELALEDSRREAERLSAAVELAIETALAKNPSDKWAIIARADLRFLTDKPKRVASGYRKAMAGVKQFPTDSVRRQIELYNSLGIMKDSCAAAHSELGVGNPSTDEARPPHVILFTGHRVDQEGRESQRFPRTAAARDLARQLIKKRVSQIVREEEEQPEDRRRPLMGIAGGASGGDLLFHDVCEELGLESALYLALPTAAYRRESVADGGEEWVRRFEHHCSRAEPHLLTNAETLPRWMAGKRDYTIWDRSNLWMLYEALALGKGKVTLISLWNGEGGDGPGGTADMVRRVEERGACHLPIDAKELLEVESPEAGRC